MLLLRWAIAAGPLAADIDGGVVGTSGRWSVAMNARLLGKVIDVDSADLMVQQTTRTGVLTVTRTVKVLHRGAASPEQPACCGVAAQGARGY